MEGRYSGTPTWGQPTGPTHQAIPNTQNIMDILRSRFNQMYPPGMPATGEGQPSTYTNMASLLGNPDALGMIQNYLSQGQGGAGRPGTLPPNPYPTQPPVQSPAIPPINSGQMPGRPTTLPTNPLQPTTPAIPAQGNPMSILPAYPGGTGGGSLLGQAPMQRNPMGNWQSILSGLTGGYKTMM